MPKADSKEEFKSAWTQHINQLYKMGNSLPEEDVDEFVVVMEDLEDFVDIAAENAFEDEEE